jgi:hypothetical protein
MEPVLSDESEPTCRGVPKSELFAVVRGQGYDGVVIPASYFREFERDSSGLGRFVGIKAEGTWTPEVEDVAQVEKGIPQILERSVLKPELIDQVSVGSRDRAKLVSEMISRIINNLPSYRRQWIGLILNKRRVVLSRFLLPTKQFKFENWRCSYISGADFQHEIWEIRYDSDRGNYEGFNFGN